MNAPSDIKGRWRHLMKNLTVVDHPLVQHKLTLMRCKDTSTMKFRNLMREISMLIGYEVSRSMSLKIQTIQTPLSEMDAPVLAKKKMALISILRAGNGILDGILQLMPSARVGHIGLYREHKTNTVIEYYLKLPDDIKHREALLLDPMLATGQSAVAAISRLKQAGVSTIKLVCLLASEEGVAHIHDHYPEVDIYTASVDPKLDERHYIVPGLGDAGDRLFGTS